MLHLPPALTLKTLPTQMVPIQGGTFMLGGKVAVTLSDFALCRFPVTQQLYSQVMGKNPSYFQGSQRPVEKVMWYDAIEFCNRLSQKQGLVPYYHIDKEQPDPNNRSYNDELKWTVSLNPQANGYRLPTEAEWEFGARGGRYGNGSEYAGSQQLEEIGWYDDNSGDETHPIGQLRPNELGLYDLSGNVWEWCWDWDLKYPSKPQINPTGSSHGGIRVARGGSWRRDDFSCRSTFRFGDDPDNPSNVLGFRLARSL